MIYEHHAKTGELPKTNANNVGECAEFFENLISDGKTVIHFTISSEMSSTYNNACLAAADFDNVYVIDSRNLSTGGGLLLIAAAEMAKNGMEAAQIVEKINELIVSMQPATVSAANSDATNPAARDAVRAQKVREALG